MTKNKADEDAILKTQKRIYVDKIIIGLLLGLVTLVVVDFIFRLSLIHEHIWLLIPIIIGLAIASASPVVPTQRFLSFMVYGGAHVLIAGLFIFFIPIDSPYEFTAFLVVYLTGWWYGQNGFFLSSLAFIAIFAISLLVQTDRIETQDLYIFAIKTVVFLSIAGILARLHEADMVERRELFNTMRNASFERQRLRSLINSMADAVIATDYDGRILVYNGAALDVLNTNASLEGEKFNNLLRMYSLKSNKAIDLIAQAKSEESTIKRDDIIYRISPDETLNLYASIAPIRISYGDQGEKGFILLLRDITKEKSIEEQRDEFISVVSHELRTPIAIAEANISTAMLPEIDSDKNRRTELLGQAHQNVIFLADMVNDITTLAHAERGDLKADIEDVDPKKILQEIAQTYEEEASEKGLKLILKAQDDVGKIRSNAYRLKEILQDFVVNAIKYTTKGSITLNLEPIDNGVRFSVADTGIGLSVADQHRVFGKFWRSEDYRTRSHQGTGLGLYIAKKLAERMHGRVGVKSKLNHGSTFYLEVPVSINEKPPNRA